MTLNEKIINRFEVADPKQSESTAEGEWSTLKTIFQSDEFKPEVKRQLIIASLADGKTRTRLLQKLDASVKTELSLQRMEGNINALTEILALSFSQMDYNSFNAYLKIGNRVNSVLSIERLFTMQSMECFEFAILMHQYFTREKLGEADIWGTSYQGDIIEHITPSIKSELSDQPILIDPFNNIEQPIHLIVGGNFIDKTGKKYSITNVDSNSYELTYVSKTKGQRTLKYNKITFDQAIEAFETLISSTKKRLLYVHRYNDSSTYIKYNDSDNSLECVGTKVSISLPVETNSISELKKFMQIHQYPSVFLNTLAIFIAKNQKHKLPSFSV